jgi:serine/threonine-protein kinase
VWRRIGDAEDRFGEKTMNTQTLMVADSSTDSSNNWVPAKGELAVGMLLDDRFELAELVSRSYQSLIFKARDRVTGITVAIKAPLLSVECDMAGFERFQREEKISAQLDHPSILKFFPVEDKSRPYIVMEFIEGETLNTVMTRAGRMPEKEAVGIAGIVCEALEHLHQKGIAHRDIKPENIILCRDGTYRLIDFGLACTARSRRLTFAKFSSIMGTPDYIAPERAQGKRGDHRSDVYSLGAILYQMVTGVPPFEGENSFVVMNARLIGDPRAPRSLRPDLSPAMDEIILHAMERDPAKRYGSSLEMKAELEDYAKVELTQRYLRLEQSKPWKARLSWMRAAGFGLILLYGALAVALFFFLKAHYRH